MALATKRINLRPYLNETLRVSVEEAVFLDYGDSDIIVFTVRLSGKRIGDVQFGIVHTISEREIRDFCRKYPNSWQRWVFDGAVTVYHYTKIFFAKKFLAEIEFVAADASRDGKEFSFDKESEMLYRVHLTQLNSEDLAMEDFELALDDVGEKELAKLREGKGTPDYSICEEGSEAVTFDLFVDGRKLRYQLLVINGQTLDDRWSVIVDEVEPEYEEAELLFL